MCLCVCVLHVLLVYEYAGLLVRVSYVFVCVLSLMWVYYVVCVL